MKSVNPIESLKYFEKNLPDFLSQDSTIKKAVSDLMKALQNTNFETFHSNLLSNGRELIKKIISKCIEFLSEESNSPKNKSIDSINRYIDVFCVFEEMLFGLDQSYRDHTLHSLWVYLFGHEFIKRSVGYDKIVIGGNIFITFSKDGEPKFAIGAERPKGSKKHLEAMWGMIAILHDLGYPVEAISSKPHEIFGSILDPFAIEFSNIFQLDLGSRISLLHQSICDLLSTRCRPEVLSKEEEEQYYKRSDGDRKKLKDPSLKTIPIYPRNPAITRDEAQEMEFRIATVDKIHSAWSAILAFKNIAYLHESDFRGGGGRDYLKLLTRRDILYSIVHHTLEEPKDTAVNRFQFVLLLMDDIEEALRYGRGGELRRIVSDYCDIKWDIGTSKMVIQLDYTGYDYKAKRKHDDLSKKYRAQISNSSQNPGYEIEMKFIDNDENFNSVLRLNLLKD